MKLTEYLDSIYGRPWSEEWSCWELVRSVQKHMGYDLPEVDGGIAHNRIALVRTFATHPERKNWVEGFPGHGAIVLMSRNDGGRNAEVHAGVMIVTARPVIWHVDKPHKTVFEAPSQVRMRGWHKLTYYRHV